MGQNSAVEITGGFYQVGDAHQGFYQISKTKNISLVVKTVCKIVFFFSLWYIVTLAPHGWDRLLNKGCLKTS